MSSEGGPEMTGVVAKFVVVGDEIARSEPNEGPVFHAQLVERLPATARGSDSTRYDGVVTERGGRYEIQSYPEFDAEEDESLSRLVREAFPEFDWDISRDAWEFE